MCHSLTAHGIGLRMISSILQGCVCTFDLIPRGNFPIIDREDTFEIDDSLQQPATHVEAMQFMIEQLREQFKPTAMGLPWPRVEEIHACVWVIHKWALEVEILNELSKV